MNLKILISGYVVTVIDIARHIYVHVNIGGSRWGTLRLSDPLSINFFSYMYTKN